MSQGLYAKPAQVTVVGAGAIGLAIAYYAARAGASVLVLDRSQVGGGASAGNAGLVVPSFYEPLCAPGVMGEALGQVLNPEGFFAIKPRLDPRLPAWLLGFLRSSNQKHYQHCVAMLSELGRLSTDLHKDLARELPLEYEYRQKGILYLYADHKKLEAARRKLSRASGLKIKTRFLSTAELLDMEPGLAPDLAGAIWYQDDAMLRPESFLCSLAQGVREAGGRIVGDAEVYDLELSRGRATALITTAGRIPVDQLVLASGAWLGLLTRRLGRGLPVEGGMGISLTFDPIPRMPRNAFLLDSHGAVTPFAKGLRITGLMRICGQDMELSTRRVKGVWSVASRYIPGLKRARVQQVWRGLRPCLSDGLPVMGGAARFKNVWLAGGHDQKGISLAPVTGLLMARLICGQKMPEHLAAALSPGRFGL